MTVQKILGSTFAGGMAQKLDRPNGTNKESVCIWNNGLVRETNGDEIIRSQFKGTGKTSTSQPANGIDIPAYEDNNRPALYGNRKLLDALNTRCPNNAGKIKEAKSGSAVLYDKNGYVGGIIKHGKTLLTVIREDDGTLKAYWEYKYDNKGNMIREIRREKDGKLHEGGYCAYIDYEYDSKGRKTREIWRKTDGKLEFYCEYKYDNKGNCTETMYNKNYDVIER